MNKDVLAEYLDAVAVIENTEADLAMLKMQYETNSVDSVKGSNPEFPYEPRVFRIEGVSYRDFRYSDEIRRIESILVERRDNARKLRIEVDAWMNTVPLRIQRIVRLRYFQKFKWDVVSARMGYQSPNAARMELERYLKKNGDNARKPKDLQENRENSKKNRKKSENSHVNA